MICKIACCDDEVEELQHLKRYFEAIIIQTDIEMQVDYFTSGGILLQRYQEEQEPYDILILDMEMPEMTGLELAGEIRNRQNRDVLILFLTNYPEYMQPSFNVQTFQYMIKPIGLDSFKEEILRALRYIHEDNGSLVFVSTNSEEVVIRAKNIFCVEKEKGMAVMELTTTEGMIPVRGNLNELEEVLVSKSFLRISRSCFVNMKHIYKFKDKNIILDNGKAVTMSRRKVTEIKTSFAKYMLRGGMP